MTEAWRWDRQRSRQRGKSSVRIRQTCDRARLNQYKEQPMCLGIPGQIVEITDVARQMALVDVSGVRREVSLECVVDDYHPLERCVGHWVLRSEEHTSELQSH